jgi:methionyl-tRNA formyltransferase
MLRKEDGEINWSRPASVIARQVRAYTPWPSAYSYWQGKLLKVLKAQAQIAVTDKEIVPGIAGVREIAGHRRLVVATGSGILAIQQLQLEGKKAMSAEEFLRGYAQIAGQQLGKQ